MKLYRIPAYKPVTLNCDDVVSVVEPDIGVPDVPLFCEEVHATITYTVLFVNAPHAIFN